MRDYASILAGLAAADGRVRASGRLHQPLAYVSITGTSNTLVLTLPDGATAYLIGLLVFNRNTSSAVLRIGTGSTLTQVMPRLGPFLTDYSEEADFPPTHFESDIYITSTVGAADPNDVQVLPIAVVIG